MREEKSQKRIGKRADSSDLLPDIDGGTKDRRERVNSNREMSLKPSSMREKNQARSE